MLIMVLKNGYGYNAWHCNDVEVASGYMVGFQRQAEQLERERKHRQEEQARQEAEKRKRQREHARQEVEARTTAPRPGDVRIIPNLSGCVHFYGVNLSTGVAASADVVDRLRVEYQDDRLHWWRWWQYDGNEYYNDNIISPLPRICLYGGKSKLKQVWYIPIDGMKELWIDGIYQHNVPWR